MIDSKKTISLIYMASKADFKKQDGFITIVALSIFVLLSIFGVIVQNTIVDTFQNIRNTNNYYVARDYADSYVEHLQYLLNSKAPGFNQNLNCSFNDTIIIDEAGNEVPDSAGCANEALIALAGDEDVKVEITIKGRSNDDGNLGEVEKMDNCPGGIGDCFVVPHPGTGTAGNRCELYTPKFNAPNEPSLPPYLANGDSTTPQLDYSCNWSKLQFGSSNSERATIPLYYDTGDANSTVFSPFNGANAEDNDQFILRMRTPCLPCSSDIDEAGDPIVTQGVNRSCSIGDDPTVCSAGDRYVLETQASDDLIVQWQLTGQCDGEDCGFIPMIDYESDGTETNGFSGIVESSINTASVLSSGGGDKAISTSTYIRDLIWTWIRTMDEPTLTIFLTEALVSSAAGGDKNIPYLEYQVLSTKPIADSKTQIHVKIDIKGNIFEKTLFQNEQKGLIDFAIQN